MSDTSSPFLISFLISVLGKCGIVSEKLYFPEKSFNLVEISKKIAEKYLTLNYFCDNHPKNQSYFRVHSHLELQLPSFAFLHFYLDFHTYVDFPPFPIFYHYFSPFFILFYFTYIEIFHEHKNFSFSFFFPSLITYSPPHTASSSQHHTFPSQNDVKKQAEKICKY